MSDTIIGTSYIVKTPGVLGGEPRIAGHRISVSFVVNLFVRQNTPVEEIVEHFGLTPAEIYAALSYYYDHQEEIDDILLELDAYEEAARTLAPDGHLDREQQIQLPDLARRIKASWAEELTATEIAQMYGISTATVREAAIKGRVPARKSGATWLIRRSDAEARWGKRAGQAGLREAKMAGKFKLTKSKSGQFMFSLKTANGQTILTSEFYKSKTDARDGIESVKKNATNDSRYERKTSSNKQPYFVLKAANGQTIGTSEMYSSTVAMEKGIASVKANAPEAAVEDLAT